MSDDDLILNALDAYERGCRSGRSGGFAAGWREALRFRDRGWPTTAWALFCARLADAEPGLTAEEVARRMHEADPDEMEARIREYSDPATTPHPRAKEVELALRDLIEEEEG